MREGGPFFFKVKIKIKIRETVQVVVGRVARKNQPFTLQYLPAVSIVPGV